MTVTLNLAPKVEAQLRAEAAKQHVSVEDLLQTLVENVLLSTSPVPTNGAELVAYWQKEGVIGTRPDITDSAEYARALRRKVETRERN
jgi:hypothetical protein